MKYWGNTVLLKKSCGYFCFEKLLLWLSDFGTIKFVKVLLLTN